jgi:hypothetical protein
MMIGKTTLERAFELAKSGKVASISELRQQLHAERYDTSQINGPALGRQLRGMMRKSRDEVVAAQ